MIIIGTEILRRRWRDMRDLNIGFDALDIVRSDQSQRAAFGGQFLRQRRAIVEQVSAAPLPSTTLSAFAFKTRLSVIGSRAEAP